MIITKAIKRNNNMRKFCRQMLVGADTMQFSAILAATLNAEKHHEFTATLI